jgi:energy-coupling factor transporter ATP-binding protein EcfA2
MFTRNTLINRFKELLLTSEKQYIVISGKYGTGKSRLIASLREDGAFPEETSIILDTEMSLNEKISELSEDISIVIIDPIHGSEIDIIRTFIESYEGDKRILWTIE